MPDPSFDSAWCADWDALSDELDRELSREDVDVEAIAHLVRARQRLTTSEPPVNPRHVRERAERKAWLLASLEREKRLTAKAEARRAELGGYLESARAATRRAQALRSEERAAAIFVNGELWRHCVERFK